MRICCDVIRTFATMFVIRKNAFHAKFVVVRKAKFISAVAFVKTQKTQKKTIPCFKTGKIKASNYRENAEGDPSAFAYEYDPNRGKIIQKAVSSIKNLAAYQVDHVFEAQIITKYLGKSGQKLCLYFGPDFSYLEELKVIINDKGNLRFLSGPINNAKGQLFADNNVRDPKKINAVKEYLSMYDVIKAYSDTRKSVITLLSKVAKENGVTDIDIENSFGVLSRTAL